MVKNVVKILPALGLIAALLSACSVTEDANQSYPSDEYGSATQDAVMKNYAEMQGGGETLFGDLSIGGSSKPKGQSTTPVNLFLWRAALETLAIGPLQSADPFGGVIITDWFSIKNEPGKQYRATAYILGRALRSDNVRVALYVRSTVNGKEVAHRATSAAETKLEDLILSRARNIRATQYRAAK